MKDFAKKEKNVLALKSKVFFNEKAMTIDKEQILMIVEESIDYVKGERVLEMGYTDRGWTDALLEKNFKVTTIEGSAASVKYAINKYGGSLDIRHLIFEEFDAVNEFDSVLMSCVLEHIKDPEKILKKAKKWIKKDGKIIIIVPNKMSLHRRVGYHMNMLKSMEELGKQDIEVGHRRHYDIDLMISHIEQAGLNGRFEKGIFLKPLSSDMMIGWPRELMWAFNKLGRQLPEWSAFLLFTAWKKS